MKGSAAPRVGRRIAIALFWVAALYVGVVGFVSITSQVFWPRQASAYDADCAEGISQLEAELLARASEHVAGGGTSGDPGAARRWLRGWDARHATLAGRCDGAGADAHSALSKLRHRVDILLVRYDREQAPLVRRIDEGLTRHHED